VLIQGGRDALRTALVTLHDEESLKLRANRLFHLKSKTVGIRLTVGKCRAALKSTIADLMFSILIRDFTTMSLH